MLVDQEPFLTVGLLHRLLNPQEDRGTVQQPTVKEGFHRTEQTYRARSSMTATPPGAIETSTSLLPFLFFTS